jgi:hypothetical protein
MSPNAVMTSIAELLLKQLQNFPRLAECKTCLKTIKQQEIQLLWPHKILRFARKLKKFNTLNAIKGIPKDL